MLDGRTQQVALGLAVIVIGFAAIAVWARLRWKKLKPELFPDKSGTETGSTAETSATAARTGDILRMARNWLSGQSSPIAKRALAALGEIETGGQATATLDGLFAKALATDDVASLLLRAGDAYTYLLAFPDRYDNARAAARYPGFADGWRVHLAGLRDRIAAGGPFAQLVAFVFFLDPDGGESALLIGFADSGEIVLPPALAGTGGAIAGDADNLSMEFRLAA